MSIRLMSAVWETKLPTSSKMVLLVISDHASDDGTNSWPSVATIARKASLGERQVKRILRELEACGLIGIELQAGGTRDMRDDRRPNRYTVNLDGVTSMTSRAPSRGDIEEPRGDIFDTHGVTPMTPKPSIEPSIQESSTIDQPDRFDEFWFVYPRKVAKKAAQDIWTKIVQRGVDPSLIIAGAMSYRDSPTRDEFYTAHPTTWLRHERWNDEIPANVQRNIAKASGTLMYLQAAQSLNWANT
jgi:hypothetical protein